MNILFYHGDETCPTMGGIQRTTALVADGLTTIYGHRCYNIYSYTNRYPEEVERYKYVDSSWFPAPIDVDTLAKYLNDNEIDIIVNQTRIIEHPVLKRAIEKAGRNCKLIFFHHTTPTRLFNYSFGDYYRKFRQSQSYKGKIRQAIKMLIYPIYKGIRDRNRLKKNASDYRRLYDECDRFVLLSERFYPEWHDITGISDSSKLRAIPNANSFKDYANNDTINNKQKRLLIVSRLIDFPKRILMAIKIWSRVAKDQAFNEWSLDIVGHGDDLEYYKTYVRRHKIPRVNFLGRQNSEPYYQDSAIFLLTSDREGWAMTLTEASQCGCVPIAFSSFASVNDIIEDGVNGILVKPGSESDYVEKLKMLMADNNLRHRMALNAVEYSKRYSNKKVMQKWADLLDELK